MRPQTISRPAPPDAIPRALAGRPQAGHRPPTRVVYVSRGHVGSFGSRRRIGRWIGLGVALFSVTAAAVGIASVVKSARQPTTFVRVAALDGTYEVSASVEATPRGIPSLGSSVFHVRYAATAHVETVERHDDGSGVLRVRFTGQQLTGYGLLAVRDHESLVTMSPGGRVASAEGPLAEVPAFPLPGPLGELDAALFFPTLPAGPVRGGATWKDDSGAYRFNRTLREGVEAGGEARPRTEIARSLTTPISERLNLAGALAGLGDNAQSYAGAFYGAVLEMSGQAMGEGVTTLDAATGAVFTSEMLWQMDTTLRGATSITGGRPSVPIGLSIAMRVRPAAA